jgi:penicillin-binding protein 2
VTPRLIVILSVFFLLIGCRQEPQQEEPASPAPTITPTEIPTYDDLYDSEIIVRTFLHFWEQNDFEEMYNLLSFASQQATDFETFRTIYEVAHAEMRLQQLHHSLRAQAREGNRVMLFSYDVIFDTVVVGSFTDEKRVMHLVLDDDNWRIAWSPGDIFAEMGNGAQLRLATSPPRRADIYDRNGNILADMNGRVLIIRVIPEEIPQYDACLNTLSGALNKPIENIQAQLEQSAGNWLVEVGSIDPNLYLQWEQSLLGNCNIYTDDRSTRRYIDGELAPHILGVVGYPAENEIEEVEAAGFQQDSILGRSGIEATWDETLRGNPGGRLSLFALSGTELRLLAESSTQPSHSVYLTIDSDLQRFTLHELTELYASGASWVPNSHGAAAVVLDVNTGEVLAMVSYPTYNANAFTTFPVMGTQAAQEIIQDVQDNDSRPQINRAAQGRYPSGSVMKSVTAIAALDSGNYTTEDTYMSIGTWDRDITRYDWLPGGHGVLNIAGAITQSCNSCFYEIGYLMDGVDPYLLPSYATRMGLGTPTGLTDIPESAGLIGVPEFKQQVTGLSWSFSDAVDMAIGQGFVEVTPLQIARTYAAIANNGTLYRPQLVHHVALIDEYSYEFAPDPMSNVMISNEVFTIVQNALCDVPVTRLGTGYGAFQNSPLHDIGVCGKTGTAQNPGGVAHAWFVGYAPRENPQIVVAVIVENSGDGSAVSAPIVRRIMEYYFFESQGQ